MKWQDDWSNFSIEIIETLRDVIHKPISDSNVPPKKQALAYALLARATSNFSGAHLLLKAHLIVEARILVRSCVETEICLKAINLDFEKFLRDLEVDDVKSRKSRFSYYLNEYKSPDAALFEQVEETLSRLRTAHGKVKPISMRQLSEGGAPYVVYGQLSTDAVHVSLMSLSRYLERDDSDLPVFVGKPDIDDREAIDTYRWGCLSAINAFETVNTIAGLKLGVKMRNVVEKHGYLFSSYKNVLTKGGS